MNIHKLSLGLFLSLGLGAVATVGSVEPAAARSVAAASGMSIQPQTDAGCFFMNGGGIVNGNCAGGKKFEVALPADNSGSKTVRITVNGAGNCYAFVTDKDGLNGDFGDFVSTEAAGGGFRTLVIKNFSLPSRGVLMAGCTLFQGEQMHSVDYNQ